MAPEIIVDKPGVLPERVTRRVEDEGRRALAARGRFSLALPGGSVATSAFPQLARLAFDWSRTDFFWGDERAVAPSHPDSNFGVAQSLWLEPARVPAERIHRMEADAPDLEAAAAAYTETMARVLGSGSCLDLAILGMGPDGHVCSLFPGHPLLKEEGRWVAAVTDSPKPPPRRLTLTLPALAAAELVVVVALGEAKATVLEDALTRADSALPIAHVARRARKIAFYLDSEAASRLPSAFLTRPTQA
jgi:6-phosphogluconolactonase